MLDVAPSLPRYGEEADAGLLTGRRPGLGESLGASVGEGWWGSTLGALGAVGREQAGATADPTPLSREDYQASGLAREGIQWDERMTRGRAEAMARTFDDNAYRRQVQAARDPGALEMALGFGAQIVGAIPDPVNFLPVAGPLQRGLQAAGAVRVASVLARPGVAASALRGSVDAVGGTVAVSPLVYSVQDRYGEEIGFDRVIADLAIGAVIGAGFGTAGGLLSRRLQPDAMASVRTLDAAARDVAAGRPMEMPVAVASRAVEDAVMRAAPPEMQGISINDLPAGPDGAPVTRAEFAALLARGQPAGAPAEAPARQGPDEMVEAIRGAHLSSRDWPLNEGGQQIILVPQGGDYIFANLPSHDAMVRAAGIDMSLEQFMLETGAIRAHGPENFEIHVAPTERQIRAMSSAARESGATSYNVDAVLPDGRIESAEFDATGRGTAELREWLSELLPAERGGPPAPETPTIAGAIIDDAYAWYREALTARQQVERMAAPPPVREAMAPGEAAEAAPRAEAADVDPDAAIVEAMRAEGRLTDADEAILRAADEQAGELEALARGQEEAGACLMRNIA